MLEERGYRPRETTEMLGIAALTFLADRPDDLARFLAASGLGPGTLRQAAADPHFLSGVLDFIAGDEALLIAFAEAEGMPPDRIAAARRALGGES